MSFQELKSHARQSIRENQGLTVLLVLIEFVVLASLTSTVIGAVLVLPITIGSAYAFIQLNHAQPAELGDLVFSLRGRDYLNHVIQLLLKNVYIFLWSLLFIIPGIVKYYSYYLVPYILASDASATDPIDQSRKLMAGKKGQLFMLQLSFLGWFILSALTFGIVYFLFVGPYYRQTMANFYTSIT